MSSPNPYLLELPAVVSFSGGRTSGYMLRKIIDAYGGKLPDDLRVVFCNTGKERPETLDFVERCSLEWDVPITWLEYRWELGRHYFVEVNYATASRKGEPFEMVIAARGNILPNPVMRFCTAELKIRTTNRFVRQSLGWETYRNAIGLRADEPKHVSRMLAKANTVYTKTLWEDWVIKTKFRSADLPPGECPKFPLHYDGKEVGDVMNFWQQQRGGMNLQQWLASPKSERPGWDLELNQDAGNCDLCFLKGGVKLIRLMQEQPRLADWWIAQENAARLGRARNASVEQFRMDRPPYAELLAVAEGRETGPGWLYADRGNVGACGELDECRCTD